MSTRPSSRAARRARVAEHISSGTVRSQNQLAQLLADEGLLVTQATLSRDLVELAATKVRSAAGDLVYAVPDDIDGRLAQIGSTTLAREGRLQRLCADLLVAAEASANLVVLKTPPGAAQLLASAIDHAASPDLLGCIAGDDTVLVITREPAAGAAMAQRFLDLAEHPDRAPTSSPAHLTTSREHP